MDQTIEELLLKLAHRALKLMRMARVRRVWSVALANKSSVCLAWRKMVVAVHRLHGRPVSNH